MAHDHAGDAGAEHEGGKDRRGEGALEIDEGAGVAARRQPAEIHGEQQDQHDAEPEIRRRDAREADHRW